MNDNQINLTGIHQRYKW